MAGDNNPAWTDWCEAIEHLIKVQDVYRELGSLPDKAITKQRAWAELQLALDAVNETATRIAPAIHPRRGPI